MLDTDAITARRNPLTKSQEARKKQEAKGFDSTKRADKVYVLAIGTEDEQIYFYVGIAKDPAVRYKAHLRGIANGADLKDAYEYVRYHKLRDTLRMVVVDEDGEFTEEDWRRILLEAGHPLQNATGGVDVKRKKREADKLRATLTGQAQPLVICKGYAGYLEGAQRRANAWSDSHYNKKT